MSLKFGYVVESKYVKDVDKRNESNYHHRHDLNPVDDPQGTNIQVLVARIFIVFAYGKGNIIFKE